jgi:hypothetical protein
VNLIKRNLKRGEIDSEGDWGFNCGVIVLSGLILASFFAGMGVARLMS